MLIKYSNKMGKGLVQYTAKNNTINNILPKYIYQITQNTTLYISS